MNNKKDFDLFVQFALPTLIIGGQLAIALKYPEFGLIINLISQPVWLYSSWKSFKEAGQLRDIYKHGSFYSSYNYGCYKLLVFKLNNI